MNSSERLKFIGTYKKFSNLILAIDPSAADDPLSVLIRFVAVAIAELKIMRQL